jgi:triacylglycerol lipase
MRTLSTLLSLRLCCLTTLTLLGAGCGSDAPTPVPSGNTEGNSTGDDGKDDDSSDESATDKGDDSISPPSNTKPTPTADASKPKPTVDASAPGTDAGKGAVDAGAPVTTAGDASTDAAVTPPAPGSHFPRATELVDIKAKGPYTVKTYTDGLSEPTYASSMMYYPEGAEPPFAVVAFTPGFTATKENYTFLGDMLASHGIAALLTTPTSTSDQPPARGKDLVAAVARIKAENDREGSPLKGKIAVDRICVTGHSMGGGGTLYAANELGDKIKCAVPMQPWQPGGSFPKVSAPILFIGAESDTIAAVAQNALPHYMSIPDTTEKIYAEFAGKDHYLSTNRTSEDDKSATPSFDPQAAYIIPFYKLFLEDDTRYRDYLYGDKQVKEPLSKYMHSKM